MRPMAISFQSTNAVDLLDFVLDKRSNVLILRDEPDYVICQMIYLLFSFPSVTVQYKLSTACVIYRIPSDFTLIKSMEIMYLSYSSWCSS